MGRALFLFFVAGAAFTAAACTADPHTLRWGYTFERDEDRARAVIVEAVIAEGSCDGAVRFQTLIELSTGVSPDQPGALDAGHYCLRGRARDADCNWFVSGRLEIDLPTEQSPNIVVLRAPETGNACPSECLDGHCTGEMPDAGMDTSVIDSAVDGGADATPDTRPDTIAPDTGVDSGCPPPLMFDPPDSCRETTANASHCGAIGNACRDDQWCRASTCECRPGLTNVGGSCRDLDTDPENCGSIGNDCSTMGSMVTCRGECEDACTSGQTNCSNACVDVMTDPRDCGTCGNACERNRICRSGNCYRYEVAVSCSSCPCSECSGDFAECMGYGAATICYDE